jgi:bifunctional non-homologous end joining protein LigD
MAALRWGKPMIVVEVSFVEWTRDGLLRHPEFVGVRTDKLPRKIRREDGGV